MVEASVKVEGGKMLELKAEKENGLSEVRLTGDFFLEPPEARREIEEALEGLEEGFSNERLEKELEKIDAEFIGFSSENVVELASQVINSE